MTFISYAQNYEDVMLWRALKNVDSGFYIDLGACSEETDSVTRAFYDHGWRGINVEPNPKYHAQLAEKRIRDVNLLTAIGNNAGRIVINLLSNPAISTIDGLSTLKEDIAQGHVLAGWILEKREVEVITLASLWQQHVPEGQEVHFLKVDIEGFEEAALRGNDWSKYRPWIIVVESTLPMSQEESYDAWEPIILSAGYRFAYADGLNRFYVSEEHADLLPSFKYPPNIFDDFKIFAYHQAEERARHIEIDASTASIVERERAHWLENELTAAKAKIYDQAGQLALSLYQVEKLESRLEDAVHSFEHDNERVHSLENQLTAAKSRIAELDSESRHLRIVADNLDHELKSVHSSYCWRLTSPLRVAFDSMIWVWSSLSSLGRRFKLMIIGLLSKILYLLIQFVLARPILKNYSLSVLHKFPRIESKLYIFASKRMATDGPNSSRDYSKRNHTPIDSSEITVSTRRIHSELKSAIDRHRRGN
ncbi:MAG TPA: FkbM family methyltransferase [Methanotrichaceae archaeon]|nr:FkbM family methyltransferase [Methanotrichaceae archaeon]HQF15832.1 FkbM family methyltransferase [Methanotrichaceae archaeon]HQI90492.1 FkbM family methyltransferase [Methanotrichaceae archaeon]HQJ28119.1 FkbM family methyltransferase [Methanotrichaceae archaeon]